MKELFQDILNIKGVTGVAWLNREGKFIYKDFKSTLPKGFEEKNGAPLVRVLEPIHEAEVVFHHCMLYIRNLKSGYILVIMDKSVPIAMIRLNCSIILPSLNKKDTKTKWLGDLLRWKK